MKRRDILQNVGALAGTAAVVPSIASADESDIEREELSPQESRSFIGTVMSSEYYRSVRDELSEEGFRFIPGQGISEQVQNREQGESIRELTIPSRNNQGGDEAEIRAVEAPDGELHIIGLVSDPESEGNPLVAQLMSNESAYNNTENGYYAIREEGAGN